MINLLTYFYLVCAALLALYSVSQVILVLLYLVYRGQSVPLPRVSNRQLPKVVVQLPLYNEKYVVNPLLDAVAALDYPHHKLTIQVLDDSTDDTVDIVAEKVAKLRRTGLDIHHIRRENRVGYKAGALAYGMTLTDAECFAILDADFLPPPDFLRQTVPHFVKNPRLGIIQTRWGHLNAAANLLTRAQSLAIDAHFVVEQTARNRGGLLLTFNGTGGLWRREAITAAGGWSADTLTEDLDLSYRAQIAGWEYLYLPDVVVPGEIPPVMVAYKRQQSRWAQGTNQCLSKLFLPVWRSNLRLHQKIMATQHLVQYLPHTFIMLLLVLTPPLIMTGTLDQLPLASLGFVGLVPPLMHALAQSAIHPGRWWLRLANFPVLMVIGTGIMVNNVRAAYNAFKSVLLNQHTEFIRTPKFGKEAPSGGTARKSYSVRGDSLVRYEIFFAVYALVGVVLAALYEPTFVPYMTLYAVSFSAIVLWNVYDSWALNRIAKRFEQESFSRESLSRQPETSLQRLGLSERKTGTAKVDNPDTRDPVMDEDITETLVG
jgi:cellulose synthase/poly-beta-1,6-N-acetylglucosamine synthase-like glycosyltransferase